MTHPALSARANDGEAPEDDPAAKPSRRRFTTAYKLAILDEYEQTTGPCAKGALLRREGLYSSHIVEWRRARDIGVLGEDSSMPRRSKRSVDKAEIERLKIKNERLESQLRRRSAIGRLHRHVRLGRGRSRGRLSPVIARLR